VSLLEEKIWTKTALREDMREDQREASHLQTKERDVSGEASPANTLILDFQLPEL
jgi:hypothetical protein